MSYIFSPWLVWDGNTLDQWCPTFLAPETFYGRQCFHGLGWGWGWETGGGAPGYNPMASTTSTEEGGWRPCSRWQVVSVMDVRSSVYVNIVFLVFQELIRASSGFWCMSRCSFRHWHMTEELESFISRVSNSKNRTVFSYVSLTWFYYFSSLTTVSLFYFFTLFLN